MGKKMFMRKLGNVENTFIGGVASVITSAGLLAAKLSIGSSAIRDFKIVGDDIECYIGVNYSINSIAFRSTEFTTASPTYWRDEGGKCTSIGTNSFYASLNTVEFYFPNVLSIGAGQFYHGNFTEAGFGLQPIDVIYLPICVDIGDPTINDGAMFGLSPRPQKLYISDYHLTSNNGGLDATLAQAIANDGLIVIYVSNFIAPDLVTDLTVDEVYSNAINLTFTPPTSTNTIDYYEVYIDGALSRTSKQSTIFIWGLNNLQTYNFKVIAVDIFYNRSGFSNTVTQQINGVSPSYLPNIISYYKFENNVLDSLVINDGTPTDITYATGQVGNAGVFNGTTSKVVIEDNSNLSFGNGTTDSPFSISFGLKLYSLASNKFILTKDDSAALREYLVGIVSDRLTFYLINQNNSGRLQAGLGVGAIGLNTMYFLTFTYDGSKNFSGIKIYVNGISQSLTNSSSGTYIGMSNTTSKLYIGNSNFIQNAGVDGLIDEIAIFDKELSQVEVTEIYNLHNSGNPLI